ncbi:MAG: hypothetical protein ACK5MU_00545 [Candidatus Saccharimonadales bacterium]
MKKLFVMILALITLCVMLAGCSKNNPNTTPSEQPTTSESAQPTPSESEEPTTPDPTPSTPVNNGSGTANDPYDIAAMPDIIEDKMAYWEIGELGYDPYVVRQSSNEQYEFVISVPEIPEKLASFAQGRGDSYIMIIVKSKSGNRQEALLVFYNQSLIINYDDSIQRLIDSAGEDNMIYSFVSGDITSTTPMNAGTVMGKRGAEIVYWELEPASLDNFTDTSYTPSDSAISAVIDALK